MSTYLPAITKNPYVQQIASVPKRTLPKLRLDTKKSKVKTSRVYVVPVDQQNVATTERISKVKPDQQESGIYTYDIEELSTRDSKDISRCR